MTADGTTHDWRGGLTRHDDGVLDAPRVRQLVDVVTAAAIADSVRVVAGPIPYFPVVLIGMSHEFSPGGANRGQRLSWAVDAAWAVCRTLIDARRDLGEDMAPLCRRCGARLDEGQPGLFDGGEADTGNSACPSCCERDAWTWTLDGVFGEFLARAAEREIHRRIAHSVATDAMIGNVVWRDGKPYRCVGMVNRTTPADAREGRIKMAIQLEPMPYIILETTIGEAVEPAAITPIEESNDDAE